MNVYPDKADKELIKAFSCLHSPKDFENFLRDLLTTAELKEMANRFAIAKTLWTTDKTYLVIAEEFHTSTTTVTRVADWLNHKDFGGYRTVLSRLYPKK